jgi:hypothetical protein
LANRRLRASVTAGFLLLLSCTDHPTTSPGEESNPIAAAAGGTGPTVRSTIPSSSPRDTTIDVLIRGSGFEQGAQAAWALDGDTTFETTRVKTNSKRVGNSRGLLGNFTIEAVSTLEVY